ncbi:unnamed protein product [Moneuplotes crassus]|uniref:Uncharacterized protein n=1 Tax=Euplotes crassus TaxID=5936 RepID=A0AAD1X9B2_EUPCR|nr:unnamed protein product [Moneuplotes crassus]
MKNKAGRKETNRRAKGGKKSGNRGTIRLLPSQMHPYKSINVIYDENQKRCKRRRKRRSKISRNKFASLVNRSAEDQIDQEEGEKDHIELLSESKTTKATKLPKIGLAREKSETKLEENQDYPIGRSKKPDSSLNSDKEVELSKPQLNNSRTNKSVDIGKKNMTNSSDISISSDFQPLIKRIHRSKGPKQGVDMFNALIEKKTSSFQLKILRNRVQKLEMEEKKARSQIENAKRRCENLEKLQEYKLREQRRKDQNLLKSQQQLEKRKKINMRERERIRREIALKRETRIESNKTLKNLINNETKNRLAESEKLIQAEKSNRYLINQKRLEDKKNANTLKISMRNMNNEQNRFIYLKKLKDTQKDSFQNYSSMQRFEKKEKEMIEKLRSTMAEVTKIQNRVKKFEYGKSLEVDSKAPMNQDL